MLGPDGEQLLDVGVLGQLLIDRLPQIVLGAPARVKLFALRLEAAPQSAYPSGAGKAPSE